MTEIPTYPDEQSIEQRIAEAEAKGFAAGLERAKEIAGAYRDSFGIGETARFHAGTVVAEIIERIRRHENGVPVPTAPARLDADKTAQPLTEIRAVVPAGKRIVQPYGVEQYVFRETNASAVPQAKTLTIERSQEWWLEKARLEGDSEVGAGADSLIDAHPLGGATAPKHFEGNVHVTQGSAAVAAPPRPEEQVRAEERELIAMALEKVGGVSSSAFVRALGPAPVDDTAARLAAAERERLEAIAHYSKQAADAQALQRKAERKARSLEESYVRVCDELDPTKSSEDGPIVAIGVMRDRLAAAEDRVRVLEGALGEVVAIVGPSDAGMMKRLQTICRAALAKKPEGT